MYEAELTQAELGRINKLQSKCDALKASRDKLGGVVKAFLFRWNKSGPQGSAQWEKFDIVISGLEQALAEAEKIGE